MTNLNMNLSISNIGALSAKGIDFDSDIIWQQMVANSQSLVKRLQMRIAKAVSEGKQGKVKALQWLLTHSFAAKILAVKRVTSNSGKKTAGVDGVIWSTSLSKIKAVLRLNRHGYKASPLRRVYIPKKKGMRPLGIPTMKDRAMQALYLLALEPVSESVLEPNSYGFRPYRSCLDAIEQCFKCLCRKNSAEWILEGDIKACFDNINHQWLMDNVITDKQVLTKWLKSGVIDKRFYPTDMGTPQGGIISPTLANITLKGLESILKQHRVNIITYADDFVVTADSKEILQQAQLKIETFLQERGLQLSKEKTVITHINEGFDFLGFNIRKYKQKLLIKPSKSSIKEFLKDIRDIAKSHKTATVGKLINLLNPKIRGWANYYRSSVAGEIFNYIDSKIFNIIWKWCKYRHSKKNSSWIKSKYFRLRGNRDWVFYTRTKDKYVDIFFASNIYIKRHIKIKTCANPYDPAYKEYFSNRIKKR